VVYPRLVTIGSMFRSAGVIGMSACADAINPSIKTAANVKRHADPDIVDLDIADLDIVAALIFPTRSPRAVVRKRRLP
jgi:predicted lipoprotein